MVVCSVCISRRVQSLPSSKKSKFAEQMFTRVFDDCVLDIYSLKLTMPLQKRLVIFCNYKCSVGTSKYIHKAGTHIHIVGNGRNINSVLSIETLIYMANTHVPVGGVDVCVRYKHTWIHSSLRKTFSTSQTTSL